MPRNNRTSTRRVRLTNPFPASRIAPDGLVGGVPGVSPRPRPETANRLFPQACVILDSFPRPNRTHTQVIRQAKRFTSSRSGWTCGQINRIQNPTQNPRDSLRKQAGQAAGAAPALRYGPTGDSAPPLRLKALVWPKGSFRPGHGPKPQPPFSLSLWMILDRSSPSRVRFAAFRALDRSGPIRRRAVNNHDQGGLRVLRADGSDQPIMGRSFAVGVRGSP